MPLALFLFVAAMIVAGRETARRVHGDDWTRAGPFERAATSALFTLVVAVALSWALALPNLLTRAGLLIEAACVLAGVGGASLRRSRLDVAGIVTRARSKAAGMRGALRREVDAAELYRLGSIVAAVVLVAAGLFFLWRSAVIFTPSGDAASYHLPKAAMLVRAHGYGTFDGPDVRVTNWPCDYELLLADVMLLDGNDVHTGWVSVGAVVFLLLSVGAIAERWWGRGRHVLVAVLLAASIRVVLLHADVHKTDVLSAAFFVTAIAFAARWATEGGASSLLIVLTTVALAFSTKGTALFLIAALGPLGVWGAVRHWRAGARPTFVVICAWTSLGLVLFLALGGTVNVRNMIETGSPFGIDRHGLIQTSYGDWGNVFRFTYLIFARPFSASVLKVWVPWRHQFWQWPRYDLYFSEWGLPSSLLLFALPLGVWRYARRALPGAASPTERAAGSFTLVLAYLLVLPIHFVPLGFFAGFVRYTLFLPVVVFLWTAVPAVRELDALGGRARRGAALGMAAGVAIFGWYMVQEVEHDHLEPLDYVRAILEHPEQRRSRRSAWNNRAGFLVDRVAGPDDVIAFDGAEDSWSYYCFGAELRRGVVFLHPDRGLPVAIPNEAKWVVVDRIISIAFGNPKFKDFGDWTEYFGKGTPSAEDMAVFNQVSNDPNFKLVYRDTTMNQAIFERVRP
jgi:hypothetical protein